MAKLQRQLANNYAAESANNRENNVPHLEFWYCYVGDYCKNLQLPFLGEEQLGKTYYMSPLNVFCFGMANLSYKKTTLDAFIYKESAGKKGGNNVASLIVKIF
eukprot:10330183-Ditylum_brightwellii.AAC.1